MKDLYYFFFTVLLLLLSFDKNIYRFSIYLWILILFESIYIVLFFNTGLFHLSVYRIGAAAPRQLLPRPLPPLRMPAPHSGRHSALASACRPASLRRSWL